MTARLPERIGPYDVIGVIGEGGMGTVLRARHSTLGVERAVKVMRGASSSARFAREADALARVRHPNVVALHEAGVDGALAYFAMDLVVGSSLDVALRDGPMPLDRALDIAAQAARGVGALHAAGVVHRDVKPENVVLTPEGRAVVIDLGLAIAPERDERLTRTGALVGTPRYLAPEQLDGRRPTPATDVHALGLLLFALVTGRAAFEADSVQEVIALVLAIDRPRPGAVDPSLPVALDRLVQRATALDPAARFADGAAFADAIEALRRGPGPSQRQVARRRAAAAGLFALLLGLGVATTIALRPRPSDAPASASPFATTTVPGAPPDGSGAPPAATSRRPPAPRASTAALRERLAQMSPARSLRLLATLEDGGGAETVRAAFVGDERLVTWSSATGVVRARALRGLTSDTRTIELPGRPLGEGVEVAGGAVLASGDDEVALARVDLEPDLAPGERAPMPGDEMGPLLALGDDVLLPRVRTFGLRDGRTLAVRGALSAHPATRHVAYRCSTADERWIVVAGAEGPSREVASGFVHAWRRDALLAAFAAQLAAHAPASLPPPDAVTRTGDIVTSVAFSPVDPDLLAYGASNGFVGLVRLSEPRAAPLVLTSPETADPTLFRAAMAHPFNVIGLVFSSDGLHLVTVARSERLGRGELRLWALPGGEPVPGTTIAREGWVPECARLSPDGRLLAVGSETGTVGLWAMPSGR